MFQRLRALSRPSKRVVTVAELPFQTSATPRCVVPETTFSNTNSVTAAVELPAGTPRLYWGSQATEIPLTSSSTLHMQTAARTAPITEGNDDGILIGVMGVTGCGKSHFCRVATGDDTIRVSNGLDSCTEWAQKHHFELDGRIITLVDTPGFDDSNHGDGYVLRNIADMLRECYQGGDKKFSAIIYLHRISDIRMGGAARKNLRLFRELCGCDSGSLKNVLLATNRWDLVTESDGRQREERLQSHPDCWKSLKDNGSTVVRFDGTRQSALTLIRSVIGNIPQPLQIQMEMVDQHKNVNDTAAGRFINEEIEKLRQHHERELAELRAEMEQVKEEDEERRRLLKEDYDRAKDDICKLRHQQEVLKADNEEALRVERKLRKEVEERMKHDMVQLKAEMDASAQAEMVQFEEKAAKQLKKAIENSRVEAEKELREAVNEESRQRIKQSREETEHRLRAEADERMKHERERLEKQMERRLKEMEQRLRDEHDLKDAGYDPGDSKNSATKALIAAVQTKQELRIILLLLAKGGNPVSCIHMHKPRGALHRAAWVGYIDAIRIFLKHGADPNAKDEDGVPPLAYAASEPAARMLLENGAHPNMTDIHGAVPLHFVSSLSGYDIAVARVLLEHGANIDSENSDGGTPLILAAGWGYEVAVRVLLANGAKPDIKNKLGNTALSLAAINGHGAIVKCLLASHNHIWNNDGNVALLEAALNGHESIVRMLLGSGASINHVGIDGNTALILAAFNGFAGIVRTLLVNGADPNIVTPTGYSALMWAANQGHEAVVHLLLQFHANLNIVSLNGESAKIRAELAGHTSIVKLLS